MLLTRFRCGIEIGLLLILACLFASIADRLHLPIPWLLIPLILSILWSIVKNNDSSIPKAFNIVGQGIIAVFTASRFSMDVLSGSHQYFFPLIVCIFITSILSFLNGYLIYKFSDLDFNTSLLGCVPGAGHSLVAMSEEMGADAIAVAVLQYLRILMVSVIVPLIVSFFSPQTSSTINTVSTTKILPSLPLPISILILAFTAIIGVKIALYLKIPANLFLGAFISSLLLFTFFPYEITIPSPIFRGGLLLLGVSIGVKFEPSIVQKLLKPLLLEIFLVTILILTCFCVGYWFHLVTNIDTLTAVLGSTPGGLSAMMATVIELGGNSGFVLTMQMTRMLLILLFTPLIGHFLLARSNSKT